MDNESGPRQTVIDEGTGFKGDFNSDCPIVVKGRVEGQMTAPSLTVDATGSVSGIVKVKELRSEGVIAGEYDADSVKLSGVVMDNTVIRAKTLEVNLSPPNGRMQVTFGQCELEVGEAPDKAAAIAAAENVGAPIEAPAAAANGEAPEAAEATEPPPEEDEASVAAASSAAAVEPSEGKRRGGQRRNTSPPPEAR